MRQIVLTGPTASGKTELALELAQKLNCEIISADSRQVYQTLTVGTAKPQGHWQQNHYIVNTIPYHLVDFLPPTQTFDVASFCQKSRALFAQKPHQPFILTGGTTMYLHALFMGLDNLPPADAALRTQLSAFAQDNGRDALHAKLSEVDPISAAQIPPQNIHRIIRALEIFHLTGQAASQLKTGAFFRTQFPANEVLFVYLHWDRELLNQRITQRTQTMLDPMADEIRTLLQQGVSHTCPGLKSLGYPEVLLWLEGTLSREQTLDKIITRTRQYAKRQRTWLNRYKNILRLDICQKQDFNITKLVQRITHAYRSN